jgi:hypothetical protein
MVERATSFSLIACVVIQGKSYEGSASVIVLDKSEPPQEPPRISISYPLDDGKQNLVGEGTLLTIMGNVQAGSNPIQKIQVLEGSNVLQEWPVSSSGEFRVDLERFGVTGRKVLRLRIVDSVGLYSEQQIVVNNDDNLLDSAARDFLRRYNVAPDGGSVRLGDLSNGPYTRPVMVYIKEIPQWEGLIREACSWWKKYTGLEFELSTGQPTPPGIYIADETATDKSIVAETKRGFDQDPHQITSVTISLYKGWLDESNDQRVNTLAHELGHGLYTEKEITEFGPYFVQWPYGPLEIQKVIIPPIVQRGIKMLYSHSPGWAP